MTPQEFEQYCFYRLYSIDLDTVRHSLRMLKRYRRRDIRHCILRDVVIGYARPFSGNTGKLFTKHHLSSRSVPSHLRTLHAEAIDVRMRILAHTSYEFRNPRITKWPSAHGPIFPMSFRVYDMEILNRRVQEIERLVEAVETSVNAKVRTIELQTLADES